jgi:hypothetical protein
MSIYSLQKGQNSESLTVYNIFMQGVLLHVEYSSVSAKNTIAQLESGATLYDVLYKEFNRTNKTTQYQKSLVEQELETVRLELCTRSEMIVERDAKVVEQAKLLLEKDKKIAELTTLNKTANPLVRFAKDSPLGQTVTPTKYANQFRQSSTFDMDELGELVKYCTLFISRGFKRHWDVNEFIEKNNAWGDFPIMRSHNTHTNGYTVNGIHKRFYAIVCRVLNLDGDGGSPLLRIEDY